MYLEEENSSITVEIMDDDSAIDLDLGDRSADLNLEL